MTAGAGIMLGRRIRFATRGGLLILLTVLAVVRDVETRSVENEAGAGRHLTFGRFTADRAWHFLRSGCH